MNLKNLLSPFDSLRSWLFFGQFKAPIVTVLGSARFSKDHPAYKSAYHVGKILAKENCWILTGGGWGVMEAVCKGAYENNGNPVGFHMKDLETFNSYLKKRIPFYSFKKRERALLHKSKALLIFPGGVGTLSELMHAMVLKQNRLQSIPIFLIGPDFWGPLLTFFQKTLLEQENTIDASDLDSISVIDSKNLETKLSKLLKKEK